MDCIEIKQLMEEYLLDDLEGSKSKEFEQHLANCEKCRQEFEKYEKFIGAFEYLPDYKPEKDTFPEFQALINSEKNNIPDISEKNYKQLFIRRLMPVAIAASVVLFVLGFFTGKQSSTVRMQSQQILAMQEEIRENRKLVMLTMLEQQSASKRIMGANYAEQFDNLEPEIVNALVHALNYDKSDNVRLEALEVLTKFAPEDNLIMTELIESIDKQDNPIMQVSLINIMVYNKEKKSIEKLQKLIEADNTTLEVKEYAKQGLTALL